MALAKSPRTPKPAEVTPTESQEPQVTEDAPQVTAPKIKAGQMVQCKLVRGRRLRQASTEIVINSGEIKELKADSWLKLQVDAGLIELVGVE